MGGKLPVVGMQAVLEDADFQKGFANYIKSTQQMATASQQAGAKMGEGVSAGAQRVKASTGEAASASETAGKRIGAAFTAISAVVGAKIFMSLAQGVKSLVMEAAAVPQIAASFQNLGGSIEAMRAASAGLTTDTELMKSYNQAAQLVSKTFAQQLPEAMGYLQKVAASTGQDMGYMLDSLVRGVGRLSPMILDNLAIQVDLTAAYDEYAASLGKSASELSKNEQQTAVMAQVMDKLRENTASMPEVAGTAAATFAGLGTKMANLRSEIGEALLPSATQLVGKLSELASEYGPKVVSAIQSIISYVENLSPAAKTAATTILGVATAVGVVGTAFTTFSALMATNPLGLAIIGITAAAVGLVALADAIQKAAVKAEEAQKGYEQHLHDSYASYDEYASAMIARIDEVGNLQIMEERDRIAALQGLTEAQKRALTMELLVATGQAKSRSEWALLTDEVQNNISTLGYWNDVVALSGDDLARKWPEWTQTARRATEELAEAVKLSAEERLQVQLEMQLKLEDAASNHARKMEDILRDGQQAQENAQIQYAQKRMDAEAVFQGQYQALLAQGKDTEAAQLQAKYDQQAVVSATEYKRQQLEL